MKDIYKSNGKLLLTAEYLVLDGALALAIPTKFGQSLTVEQIETPNLIWESLDENNTVWFKSEFKLIDGEILRAAQNDNSNNEISERLLNILNVAKQLNPEFLKDQFKKGKGIKVTTNLGFPKNWGLGTSSTLLNNIASWASIDAYKLLELTFGGSGYDIACAQNDSVITYQLIKGNEILREAQNNNKRIVKSVTFNPPFKDKLYFVYLNRKQNSRDAIAKYKAEKVDLYESLLAISTITTKLISSKTLEEFIVLIDKHESIISKILKEDTIKTKLFQDFKGSIKSLGAWNGDFVLVASNENPKGYFKSKGFETILSYNEMVLEQ